MDYQTVTYHVKLLAEHYDILGYTNYVFEDLEYKNYDYKYIMCVRFPNWNQAAFKLDDEGYVKTETRPVINSIAVDDAEDTITIDADNALIIRWISDGKLIATTKADDTAFDLNDYEASIKGYVRAEVFGEGGIIYTESFTLNADEATGNDTETIFDLGFLDFIFAMLDRYVGLFGRIIGNLF